MVAPRVVKEVTEGTGTALSLDAGQKGTSSTGLRFQRLWKLVYASPTDILTDDVRDYIGVTIGAVHPTMPFCVCDSLDIKPDGDSRHAYTVTANYSSSALSLAQGGLDDENADPRSQAPDNRKANWSTDVTTVEAPSWLWREIYPNNVALWGWAVNPVGDLYDGVMTMQPVMTIKIEQTQSRDPNIWAGFVGHINTTAMRIGALTAPPHSVMLRGISATPHAEIVGKRRWRGWKANYEFIYKAGYNSYLDRTTNGALKFLGWDVATPVTGWNVVNAGIADNTVDKGALSLKLTNDNVGSIDGWEGGAALEPTLANKKTRANVLISAPGSKAMQRPSAQPVALNLNGTPRNLDINRVPRLYPLIQVNQVYMDFEMNNLQLRLD